MTTLSAGPLRPIRRPRTCRPRRAVGPISRSAIAHPAESGGLLPGGHRNGRAEPAGLRRDAADARSARTAPAATRFPGAGVRTSGTPGCTPPRAVVPDDRAVPAPPARVHTPGRRRHLRFPARSARPGRTLRPDRAISSGGPGGTTAEWPASAAASGYRRPPLKRCPGSRNGGRSASLPYAPPVSRPYRRTRPRSPAPCPPGTVPSAGIGARPGGIPFGDRKSRITGSVPVRVLGISAGTASHDGRTC